MKQSFPSLVFLVAIACCSCHSTPTGEGETIRIPFPPRPAPTVAGSYITKPPRQLFYADEHLQLNEDATFSYACITCMGVDSSFGTWIANGNLIQLHSADLRSLTANRSPFERIRYRKLQDLQLIKTYNYLLWRRADETMDTLVREESIGKLKPE